MEDELAAGVRTMEGGGGDELDDYDLDLSEERAVVAELLARLQQRQPSSS